MVKWRKGYSYSYIRKSQVCGSMFGLWYAMHTDENTDDHGDVKGRGLAEKLFSIQWRDCYDELINRYICAETSLAELHHKFYYKFSRYVTLVWLCSCLHYIICYGKMLCMCGDQTLSSNNLFSQQRSIKPRIIL